jgi:hypothetical protein
MGFVYNGALMSTRARAAADGGTRRIAIATGVFGLALAVGFGLLPALIYYAGNAVLGPYEGSSVATTYGSIFRGLGAGSLAAWTVVLGPALLYLLYRLLRAWWRVGT